MSFTLMRHKDGKAVPIKLSIWDAFKGAPPPKRRLHECTQCGKLHSSGTKHETATPAGEAASKTKNGKPTTDAKSDAKSPNEHNFTAEEDAKILEMKDENTSWADIAKPLGNDRTKGLVSHRFRELKAAESKNEQNPAKEEKKEDKPFEQMTKAEKRAFNAKKAREEGLKKREAASKEKTDAAATVGDGKTNSAEAQGQASASEVKVNQSAIKDRQKWVAAASKHFDRTGQRITPEQAQRMVLDASQKK